MLLNLKSNDIKVGMFVILPKSLLENPFWKSQFIIKKENQIQKIVKSGFKEVKVDTDKSTIEIKTDKILDFLTNTDKNIYEIDPKDRNSLLIVNSSVLVKQCNNTINAPDIKIKNRNQKENNIKKDTHLSTIKYKLEKSIPAKFKEVIKDTSIAPDERAKAVHDYSTQLMKNILESPTAENITTAKKGIAENSGCHYER